MWNINKRLTKRLTKQPTTDKKKKQAYFVSSLYLHGWLLFLVLSNWERLMPEIIIPSEQVIASEYTKTSRQRAMQERIDDMEAVKKMLDQLQYDQFADKQLSDKQIPDKQQPVEEEKPNTARNQNKNQSLKNQQANNKALDIDDLYKKSERLLSEIKDVEQDILTGKLKALEPILPLNELLNEALSESLNEPLNKLNEDKLMAAAKEAFKKLKEEAKNKNNQQNDSENEQVSMQEPLLSDEQKQQKTTDNQLSMRNIFEKIQLSQQSKSQGNSTFTAKSASHQNASQNAFSKSPFSDYDTNSPLSIENHFSKISRGNIKDVSQEMRKFYQQINKQNGITVASIGESTSSTSKYANTNFNNHYYFSRKLIKGTQPSQWLALNSWYFIGPFPNNNRENIHTRFPPEVAIDLNAMYLGKYNKLLKWQHIQYDHFPIIPPDYTDYAVYYAYCEFYSDSERDVWLAIASDDQSKMWINKMLVWQSSAAEKAWEQGEGHRKISLKKGRNKLLFRLENGVDRAAFSILMSEGIQYQYQ
ncbi:MAG: hypothetical protein OCD00_17360 [Colwellia sp.]